MMKRGAWAAHRSVVSISKREIDTPNGLKIAPRVPGTPRAPGCVKITPGDPGDHFRKI